MEIKKDYKVYDRVQVVSRGLTDTFTGQVGTVVNLSLWVFGSPEDVCYLVSLDSGVDVTCDPEDLKLAEEGDD